MDSFAVSRLRDQAPFRLPSTPSPPGRRLTLVRSGVVMPESSDPLSPPLLRHSQVLTILVAMGGLGMMAWMLDEKREENSRQQGTLRNFATLVRASLQDHEHTKRLLADARADKRLMQHFLSEAGRTEQELKEEIGNARVNHDKAVHLGQQHVQAWSAHGTALKASLEAELSKRGETEQVAAHFEAEAHRLAGETAGLHDQMSRLQQEGTAILEELGRLQSYSLSLEGENSALKNCNEQLHGEVRGLQSEKDVQQATISSLQSRIICLEGEVSQLSCQRDSDRERRP